MRNQPSDVFRFTIEEIHLAIPLSTVDRVIRSVSVATVPNAPAVIHGIIDYYGLLVPVINLRYRLKLQNLPVRAGDIFILADTPLRKLALVADTAEGVVAPLANDMVTAASLDKGFEADGMLRRDDGIILIYDLEKFLSPEEERELDIALVNQTRVKEKP